MFYFVKTPKFIDKLYPRCIWRTNAKEKNVYLTFDDGPTSDITEFVLSELKKHKFKATFFCVGENIEKHKNLTLKIINEGHNIANHTDSHLNGYKSVNKLFYKSIDDCQQKINELNPKAKKLFRPPFGKIKKNQIKYLINKGYKIVMWSILSGDFDNKNSADQIIKNVKDNLSEGSIIVFHDSIKCASILKETLPKTLEFLANENYKTMLF